LRVALPKNKTHRWLQISPWKVLAVGALLALSLVTVAIIVLLQPPFDELVTLVGALAITSVLSLAAGYILYRNGWAHFPSISLTLVLTYAWAAILTLFNVWVLASFMFVDAHDFTLASILLVFAAIIATTYGISVSSVITDNLRQLAFATNRLARGDLDARAEVYGRDEVSQVAEAFNDMAEQLQESERKREEIENLRRDLIAWTSHDLRTPLTSIRVMVEALNDGLVTDEETRNRYHKTIHAEIVFLNKLIDDLFELAQLDADKVSFEMAPDSLSDLISDTLNTFGPLAKKKQVTLTADVSSNLDPVVMNSSRIGRVLTNIVDNAIQHSLPGGAIQLSAIRNGGEVKVTVSDEGTGFSSEELPRVFEKFYRGESARSRATGGAGLGLAIAAGIVEAHDGRIWARNREEGGASISFTLPT
jgi:signal transduction histidine kinase